MKNYQIGETVVWESQANGYKTLKQGKVVARVPYGSHPKDSPATYAGYWKISSSMNKFEEVGMRDDVSYLVSVEDHSYMRPKLYWPRTSSLINYEEEYQEILASIHYKG